MSVAPKISASKLKEVRKLYYKDGLSMSDIALRLNVSLDAVVAFMRRHKLKRRNSAEANACLFEKKIPSFSLKPMKSNTDKELRAIGAMLYWGEGYKSEKASGIDFANSDPEMISMFLRFLRNTYSLDEKKFRILLYCYEDQNHKKIINFWSKLTGIPKEQFSKPYVRKDFRSDGRKMPYGLIHIRYFDKKLLFEIKKLIEYYRHKFCVGGRAVNCSGL